MHGGGKRYDNAELGDDQPDDDKGVAENELQNRRRLGCLPSNQSGQAKAGRHPHIHLVHVHRHR
jgi:hypothetical protein